MQERIDRRGHVVRVVVATPLGRGGAGGIDRLMDNLAEQQTTDGEHGLVTSFRTTRGPGSIFRAPWVLLVFLMRLVADASRGEVDLLHINLASHGSTYRKIVVARVARTLGVPYVLHLHGAGFHHFVRGASPGLRRRVEAMFAAAARVLVLGEVWRTFVEEQIPAAAGRVVVLPNATPAPRLEHIPSETVRVLFLGRIGERKGVPQLIQALGRMPRDLHWHAVLSGDGDLSASRAQIAELALTDRVELTGWVGPEGVERLLAASDVLVLASFDENLPMSVIEAMGAGLAVVTTPVGATADIVEDGVTGLLVPPGDVDALSTALVRLIRDPDLRRRLGAAAQRVHVERLEIGSYVARLEALWCEVIKESRSGSDRRPGPAAVGATGSWS